MRSVREAFGCSSCRSALRGVAAEEQTNQVICRTKHVDERRREVSQIGESFSAVVVRRQLSVKIPPVSSQRHNSQRRRGNVDRPSSSGWLMLFTDTKNKKKLPSSSCRC